MRLFEFYPQKWEGRTKNYRQNSKSNDTNNDNQEFYYQDDAMIETESWGKSGANMLAMEKDKPKYGQCTEVHEIHYPRHYLILLLFCL